ncbi:hypothetical protein J6590_072906 [Homalodisca vitripennis]|nr:hypothetical protein J6590_072906 [Homalodisca vitripennis]
MESGKVDVGYWDSAWSTRAREHARLAWATVCRIRDSSCCRVGTQLSLSLR